MTHSETMNCSECAMRKLHTQLSESCIAEIENHIFKNEILAGIKLIKETLGISLAESLELFSWMHRKLRITRPEEFLQSEQDYWNGFYS